MALSDFGQITLLATHVGEQITRENAAINALARYAGGLATVTLSAGANALTADQSRCKMIDLTGALASAANAQVVDGMSGQYFVRNSTTGGQTVTFRSANGASASVTVAAGTSWQLIQVTGTSAVAMGLSITGFGDFFADGSVPMTGDLDMDGNQIVNLGAPSAGGDAVNKTYADALVTGLLDFKGSTDCSANPNYPGSSLKGDAYIVTVAGKIGGASGKSVEVGDVYVASADNAGGTEGAVGTSWFVLEHNLVGAALLAANNVFTGNNEFQGQFWSDDHAATDGVNITIDFDNGNVQYVTINGNRTLNISNVKPGGIYTLIVTQGAGGPHLLGYSPAPDFWINGAAPTLATGAGEVDILTFWYANSVFYGYAVSSEAATNRLNLGAAPLDSPIFINTPAAPTAAPGTNTTQLATTAFVTNAVTAGSVDESVSAAAAVFNYMNFR